MNPPAIRFPLETERLLIRPIALEDVEDLHEVHADPTTWDFIGSGPTETLDATLARLARTIEYQEQHGISLWAVVERASGRVVGDCGLQYLEGGPDVEVGYRLHRSVRGRGYTTEAARACVEAGFDQLGLERIVAVAWPENTASRRVMEKIGMRLVGPGFHYNHASVLYEISRPRGANGAAPAG